MNSKRFFRDWKKWWPFVTHFELDYCRNLDGEITICVDNLCCAVRIWDFHYAFSFYFSKKGKGVNYSKFHYSFDWLLPIPQFLLLTQTDGTDLLQSIAIHWANILDRTTKIWILWKTDKLNPIEFFFCELRSSMRKILSYKSVLIFTRNHWACGRSKTMSKVHWFKQLLHDILFKTIRWSMKFHYWSNRGRVHMFHVCSFIFEGKS